MTMHATAYGGTVNNWAMALAVKEDEVRLYRRYGSRRTESEAGDDSGQERANGSKGAIQPEVNDTSDVDLRTNTVSKRT